MTSQPATELPPLKRPRRPWGTRIILAVLFLGAAGALACGWLCSPPGPVVTPPKAEESDDARYRRLVPGTWEDDYQGKRTMTVREDGTATMVVELTGIKAFLSAPRLEFDMEWSINNGRMMKRTVSGRPPAKVALILKTMGDRVDEPILELTEKRLLLLDADGRTKYDWRRVE